MIFGLYMSISEVLYGSVRWRARMNEHKPLCMAGHSSYVRIYSSGRSSQIGYRREQQHYGRVSKIDQFRSMLLIYLYDTKIGNVALRLGPS